MCRTRISTWARRAARTNTLVNHERWAAIQANFPEQVQKRLSGEEEEDPEMNALNISIRLAEPGEIRSEYEQQLKKLQEQRAEESKKEQEASERLIKQLQEEEARRQAELEALQRQDEELAKQLSQNASPGEPDFRTRSSASNSSSSRPTSTIENFLGKLQADGIRSPSPYPYRCLTPVGEMGKLCVDKIKAKELEENFLKKKIKKDKNLITTSDIEKMEENFTRNCRSRSKTASATEVAIPDSLETRTKASASPTLTNAMSTASLHPSELLDQMSGDVCINLTEEDSNLISLNSSPKHDLKDIEPDTGQQRSTSAHSMDSITQELNHFRPIRSCPLTPPRRLPSGAVVEPKLIRTTPRNLSSAGFTSPVETNLSDIDAGSPVMQRRLSQLADERKDKVEKMSKSTSTGEVVSPDENKNPSQSETRSHAQLHFSHVGSRNAELKDISNSPLTTQNLGRKLIIPLEPDLGEGDWMDISETLCPIKIERQSPIELLPTASKAKKQKLSRSLSKSKSKVKYSVEEAQSPILKWIKTSRKVCVDHKQNRDEIVCNGRDEVDGIKIGTRSGNSHSLGAASLDKKLVVERAHARPKRKSRMYKDPDYVYEGGACSKGVQETDSSDDESNGSEIVSSFNNSKKRKSSSSTNSPRKKVKTVTNTVTNNTVKPVSRHKGSLKTTKQSVRSKKLANSRKTQQKSVLVRTLHDYFQNADDGSGSSGSDCELDQEERDRKLALELQKQFELEAKLHLSALRFKGSKEEYSLRKNRKARAVSDN